MPLLFPNLTDAEYQSIAHEFGLDDSGTIKYEKFVECAAVKIKKDKGLKWLTFVKIIQLSIT